MKALDQGLAGPGGVLFSLPAGVLEKIIILVVPVLSPAALNRPLSLLALALTSPSFGWGWVSWRALGGPAERAGQQCRVGSACRRRPCTACSAG